MPLLTPITLKLIARAEARVGVTFDYVRKIATTDIGLLTRYNRLFGFIDPRKHLPQEAYHAARLRAALSADCGTCVEAEINLAMTAGLSKSQIKTIISGQTDGPVAAVIALTDAVVRDRIDAPAARETIIETYGEKGLVELSFAMNGAALLPGIKRAMGYATHCDITAMKALQ